MIKEETRRELVIKVDDKPSIHHKYNFEIAKEYIKNKKVLDIGCWTGNSLSLMKKMTKKLYGIDPGKEAIEYAKERLPFAHFKTAKAQSLGYKDNFFDVVLLLEVIEHIPQKDEGKVIKEAYRVLKSDGYLVLSTPYKNIFSILGDPAYFIIAHRHYSEKQLSDLLTKNGFEIVKVTKSGGLFRILTVNIELLAKHIFNKKIKFPKFIERLVEDEYKGKGFFEIHVVAKKLPIKLRR